MKTKSSKAVLIYLPIAVIIASVIRFFQYVSLIDFKTGFYKLGTEAMGALIYIILAATAVGYIILTLIRNKAGDAAFTLSSDGMGNLATQAFGVACPLSAIMMIVKATSSSGLDMALSVAAVILFAAIGFLMMKNVVPPAITGHLFLALALYMFIVTAIFFNGDLIILSRSDNLILLLVYVLFTLFLASLARFCSRLETKHSRIAQIILGGLTFIAAGTHVLSKLIALLFGGEAVKGMDSIAPDAVAALLVCGAFLFMIFVTTKKKNIEYITDSETETDKKAEADEPVFSADDETDNENDSADDDSDV